MVRSVALPSMAWGDTVSPHHDDLQAGKWSLQFASQSQSLPSSELLLSSPLLQAELQPTPTHTHMYQLIYNVTWYAEVAVRLAMVTWAQWSGVRISAQARHFSSPKHPDQLCNPPSLVLDGYGKSLPQSKSSLIMRLTSQLHSVPRLWWVQLNLHTFMACAGTNLPLYNMQTITVLLWLDNITYWYWNVNNLKQQWSTVTCWPDSLPIILICDLCSATTMIMAVLWMHDLTSVHTAIWYSKGLQKSLFSLVHAVSC